MGGPPPNNTVKIGNEKLLGRLLWKFRTVQGVPDVTGFGKWNVPPPQTVIHPFAINIYEKVKLLDNEHCEKCVRSVGKNLIAF